MGPAVDPSFQRVFGLGTALSAPLVMLLALVAANVLIGRGEKARRVVAGVIALLGTGFVVGMLVEPIAWDVLDTFSFDPVVSAIVSANLLLPLAMVISAVRILGRVQSASSVKAEEARRG